jgi:predicted ATPase
MMLHMTLATKVPEFAITEGEAEELAQKIANYARHSNVAVKQQTIDLVLLIGAVAMIEGTRVVAAATRIARERRASKMADNLPGVVTAFPGQFGT